MTRAAGTIPAMTDTSQAYDEPRATLAEMTSITQETRAIVAALDTEDDPTLRERVDRVYDRLAKVEEAIALLMDRDVEDQEMPEREPVAAGFTEGERSDMADEGSARPDGSFPIESVADLHNAIRAYGRAKDPAAAKQHIKKRASELGAESALPDAWE